jgi:pimeloyl-ACP methyl ester carboxylesterase
MIAGMPHAPEIRRVPLPGGVGLSVVDWVPDAPAAAERAGGPVYVLVHGLASNARLWDGVAMALQALGHRAVAVDLRGHGLSDKPDDGYDMATVAADVCGLLDALELDRPVVAGQSWGANVVVELAAAHPGRARGIVPVDGGFIHLGARFPRWEDCEAALAPPRFAGTPFDRFQGWIRQAHPDWPETGIQGTLANVQVHSDGTVSPWLTFERHIKVLHGLWEHNPYARLSSVRDPVLWMPADSGDVAWTADKRAGLEKAMDALQTSRVEWFSPADHDLHAQFPARVAHSLVEAVESGFFA